MCSFSLSAWNSKINRKPSAFGRFGINTASSTPCKFIMIADYLLTYELFRPPQFSLFSGRHTCQIRIK